MKKHKIIIGGTVALALLSINAQRAHVIVNADSSSIIDSSNTTSTATTTTTSSAVTVKTNSEVPSTIITDTKSEVPVLSPSSQLRPVNYWANTIYITNDKQDADYYYTTDGSTPTIFSNKVEINYEGRHVIYPNNSYSPKTIVMKVIAIEEEKEPSDVATATVTYAERTGAPKLISDTKSKYVDMNKAPLPIYVDKDNIKTDTDYYYSINAYGDEPDICDENKLKPNSDGEYIIQPPTLDLKYNTKLKVTVIAVKKDMAPSYRVSSELNYI